MTSVVITRATATKQVPKFIRDILRNNLTDPINRGSHFIFKDIPEMNFTSSKFPYIVITGNDSSLNSLTLDSSKWILNDFELKISLTHDNPKERDELTDQIITTLTNPTSTDTDGTSLKDNKIKIKSIKHGSRDTYLKYPKIMRVKEITVTLNYYGL